MANQEGGAHVDPAIKSRWAALTRLNSLGWGWHREDSNMVVTAPAGPEDEPMGNPLPANIRRLPDEVEETLTQYLSHLLADLAPHE